MARAVLAHHEHSLVRLSEIAMRLGASTEHVRGWLGEDNVLVDWAGYPATTAKSAREIVEHIEADAAERAAADIAAVQKHEERIRLVRERYSELAREHADALRAEAGELEPQGAGVFHRIGALMKTQSTTKEALLAQAEREVDSRA